jgi:phosphohistidine swiveling domain-containing protein
MTGTVVSLASRKASRPELAGGKGAGLARLVKDRFPVPDGFVITTAALRETLRAALETAAAPGGPDLAAARRYCLGWEAPVRLRREVLDAYRRLGAGPVAVRSSMVGEDAAVASFAGQLETVLDVSGEDALLDAVRRVLASVFGDRLWAYLERTAAPGPGLPGRRPTPALAVVVQKMVRAAVSGVAFSVDPVTCRPGVVIEAVAGPGEALVQGRARPDRYRLDPRGEIDEIVPAAAGKPLLDEAGIMALGGLVHAVAGTADEPQDVEWALDGLGFHVLQARPISSIAGKPVYSRRMVSDMAPGVVKPLVWSAKYAPVVTNVFARVFEEIVGRDGFDYSRLSARLHSRVYMNVTAFGEVLARMGLPPNFFYVLARGDRAARRRLRPRPRMVPALVRHVRFVRRESSIGRRVGPFVEAQRRELDALRALDWGSLPPEDLLSRFDRLKALHARSQWYVILVSVNMLIRNRVLSRMIGRRWPGTDPRDVIKGYGRRSSLAPFEELRALAEGLGRFDRGLIGKIAGPDELDPAALLEAADPVAGRAAAARFDGFMARFGFLSANGSDFSEAPWIETPRLVWRTVGRLALQPDPGAAADRAEARREEVLGLVRAGINPVTRLLFDRLHASTVRYMDCRERVSLVMTEDSYLMRRCLLALGARLFGRGTIAAPDDVFFFFEDELARLVADPAAAAAAAGLVATRRAELARDAALDPPDTLCGGEMPLQAAPSSEGLAFLSGIGASAGVVRGRARVVLDPAGAVDSFGPGDVLVVPFTDIGWAPLFAGAGGIVAETGGQLSHTSIIAREYGIPAVVSVRRATRIVRDGMAVTLDGTAGRLYLHPEGPAE